jgi:myo-inositol-1(or 4)-monophosphatase
MNRRSGNPSGKRESMVSLESVVSVAVRAAELAEEMQRAGLLQIRSKGMETDLVTAADTACEHLLRDELGALAPEIGFWGEESNRIPEEASFWLVDPIDGTVNFAHGLTYCAVNVTLIAQGELALGVTVQIPYRRIYVVERGRGAWLREPHGGEIPLQVSDVRTLRAAFLATGFPYHSSANADNNDAEFGWFSPRCLGLRVLGAGALDIAQVAAGMLAGFWEGWLNPWDAAAGVLMVREAGGVVTDYAGNDWRFSGPGLVASNGHIHEALLDGIRTARATLKETLLPV